MPLHSIVIALAAAAALAIGSRGSGICGARAQDGKKQAPTYVGALACRKCHADQYNSWKQTRMANAFDLLKPGVHPEAKEKAGLDPGKDYSRDEKCLPCHVTGWGEPGGYAIPPAGETPEAKKLQKEASALEGVQCEMCHGPASRVVAHKEKNEAFQWSELEKLDLLDGVQFPTQKTCERCHNEKSPFVTEGYVFDFETRKEEGTHKHYRMDMDHGCPHQHTPSKKKKTGQ